MDRKIGNRVSRRPQNPPVVLIGILKNLGIEECPQCKAAFNDTNCRPVQDSCGHFKCRVCFIGNEDGCSQCKDAQPSRTRKGGPSTSRAIDNENCNGNAGSSNIGKSSNSQLKSKIDVSNHAPLVSGPNKNPRPPLELNSVSELESSCLDPIYQGNSNIEGECRGLPNYSINDNLLLHSRSYSSIFNQELESIICLMSLRKAADLQKKYFATNGHGLPNCTRNNYVPTDNSNLDCTFPSLVPLGSTERGLKVVDSKIYPTTYSISLGSEPRPIIIEPVAVDIDSSNVAPLITEHTFELVTVSYLDLCPTDTPALSIPFVPAPKSPTKNVSPTEPKDKKKKKRNPIVFHDHVTVISGDPTMFQCNVCQKKFKTKAHIKYHEFCQNGNKPFKCQECGKGFIIKSHYEYHLRTHTGERPYICPKCGKGFNQRGKVTRHMKSHTGEKPFICTECGRGFKTSRALKSHQLIHSRKHHFSS